MNIQIDVPFRYQEHENWCVPACVEMMHVRFDRHYEQATLASKMQTSTATGTTWTAAAWALKQAGLPVILCLRPEHAAELASRRQKNHFYRQFVSHDGIVRPRPIGPLDVEESLENGLPVMAGVMQHRLWSPDRPHGLGHCVLIVGLTDRHVAVHDPYPFHGYGGPNRWYERRHFAAAWHAAGDVGLLLMPYV